MPVFGSQGMKKIERIAVAGNSGGKKPAGDSRRGSTRFKSSARSGSGRLANVNSPHGRGSFLLACISGAVADQDHGLAFLGRLCRRNRAFMGLGVLGNVVACG